MDASTQHIGDVRAEFIGEPRRFFRIALIGNLLQIPTVGFYRFWLITDIRRHLWSHTRLGGDAFEYTGRGRELLIGFLIAMAILMPIYIGYFILSIEAERWQAFASLPLFLIIYVLMHYGTYRARRYRATRTIFRGARLWMAGSGWAYAARAILWDFLTIISLGLALPWREAVLERYRMQHTYFGDLQGSFAGRGWVLFKRGWWLWLMAALPFVLILAFGAVWAAFTMSGMTANVELKPETGAVAFGVGFIFLIPVLICGFPIYRAMSLRWRLEGLRFGELFMTSSLRKRSVLWAYGKSMLIGGVIMSVVGIILQTVLVSFGFSFEDMNAGLVPPIPVLILLVGFYTVAIMGFAVVTLQFVTRGVWELTVNSLTVFNIAALDAATARGQAAGSIGEGLADALDFGGGVGV